MRNAVKAKKKMVGTVSKTVTPGASIFIKEYPQTHSQQPLPPSQLFIYTAALQISVFFCVWFVLPMNLCHEVTLS
jgi:prolipoprotein diacylglyceryltransferase